MAAFPTLFIQIFPKEKIYRRFKKWGEQALTSVARNIPVFLCLCLIMGCCMHSPGPHRPGNWIRTPTDMEAVADGLDRPVLQVIIVYGPLWCHHTAVRLVCPDRPVLFWDPGGSYDVSDSEETRVKDLIRVNPPDLERYLRFTWEHSSEEVEVFEWDLTVTGARKLYDVLVQGTGRNHPVGRFTPATAGGFCSFAVSDFLRRFAGKTVTVPGNFLLPHNLAKVLYTQSPKRVLVFRRRNKPVLYVDPAVNSGQTRQK